MVLRLASDDDWRIFTRVQPPGAWFGLVEENAYMILGLGGAFLGDDGRWWATFRRAPGVRHTLTAHKAAKLTLAMAAERGVTLHAIADEDIRGAELWLRRLGFEKTAERYKERAVWKWDRS